MLRTLLPVNWGVRPLKVNLMLIECKACSALVEAKEIATHFVPRGSDELPELWTFSCCPSCKGALLAFQYDYGNGFDEDTPTRMYPPMDRRLGWTVPQAIRSAFSEAIACFKVKAYTASAIMCRKAVEALCSEHGATERNLAQSLRKLKEDGVIEARLYEWAEELRQLGNAAAHGVDSNTSREDASDMLEFTEALCQYVFTYRDKFKEFQARREISTNP